MSSANALKDYSPAPSSDLGASLYDRLGGPECLDRVHKVLYDKIFAHPVFGIFFAGKDQQDQQSDFMAMTMGGPSLYRGRPPEGAHQHLFITSEMFELRQEILAETLDECGVSQELRDEWMAVDRRFERVIVKKSIDDCEPRYRGDEIIVAPGTAGK